VTDATRRAVDAASTLGARLVEVRDETEADRDLPASIVSELVEAEMYRLALPSKLGGPEVDPVSCLEIFERLARSEAAAAWTVWNSALPCLFARYLGDDVREQLFGNPDGRYASSTRPSGRMVRENGAYRMSGRWALVSGCTHADWIGLMCRVETDGEVEMLSPQMPHMRMGFVPRSALEIVDTWHVGGLRGTGSHDVVADDVVVAAERTFTPADPIRMKHAYARMPITATMSAGHAAICLGIASAALHAVLELAPRKTSTDALKSLPHRASNQFLVAESATRLRALRAWLRRTVERLWERAVAGDPAGPEDIADVFGAAVTAARASRSIVSALYEVAGTTALYVDFPLERQHRDIHAAMQHVVVQRF